MLLYAFFSAIILGLGINAIYNMYVSLYVKVRKMYVVNCVNIGTKSNGYVYEKVSNYKKINGGIKIMIVDEGVTKSIYIPEDDIAYVDKCIDTNTNLLGLRNSKSKKSKVKKKVISSKRRHIRGNPWYAFSFGHFLT